VRQREQGRSRVSYLEGWQVIAEANRIFGFDGWERSTLISRCVAEHERPVGRDRKSGWGITYIARVRITITAGVRRQRKMAQKRHEIWPPSASHCPGPAP
jgi:recombination DNA repair RAD52 pathway protein